MVSAGHIPTPLMCTKAKERHTMLPDGLSVGCIWLGTRLAKYVFATIFTTGGKFRPVSKFTELHARTLAARSYVLLLEDVCSVNEPIAILQPHLLCLYLRMFRFYLAMYIPFRQNNRCKNLRHIR